MTPVLSLANVENSNIYPERLGGLISITLHGPY